MMTPVEQHFVIEKPNAIFVSIVITYRHHRLLGLSKEVQYISVPQGALKL